MVRFSVGTILVRSHDSGVAGFPQVGEGVRVGGEVVVVDVSQIPRFMEGTFKRLGRGV